MILRLIVSRLALAIATLLAVSFLIFWAVEWLPGDPAARILGREATPESVAALRAQLHLSDPPLERYGKWLEGFASGDWGISLAADRPVTEYVLPRLRNTLMLAGLSLAVYLPLSFFMGILGSVFRDGWVDTWVSTLSLVGMSMPEFVVGILLIFAFAVVVPVFPALALIDQTTSLPDLLRTLTLPALTLTAAMTAYALRMMRGNLIEVLESEYISMAILKGLPKTRVVLRHALPNALGPTLNVTALNISWLIGGVVVVEKVFNFPGLGRLLVDSISFRDIPVVEAITLILAAIYVFSNLCADIAVLILNPRLRG